MAYIAVKLPNKKASVKCIVDDEDYEGLAKMAWHITWNGYAKHDKLSMHRVIMQAPKGKMVDHINGNRIDNRKVNLRLCTNGQNMMNRRRLLSSNTSGVHGVTWDKARNKWLAQIMKDERNHNLGHFATREEAFERYKKASKELFGEFSPFN